MLNGKEILTILIATLILTLVLTIPRGFSVFLVILVSVFLVILINILAKKITSFYLDSEIEIEFWKIKSYGFSQTAYFRKPFLAGVFFPIILTIVTLGKVSWMAPLTFEVKPKSYRAAKRHGLYSFSEMTESHIGTIAAAGIIANLAFAVIGYLLGYSEFSRISAYFAFFNMLPLSDLDGNKIFFGNIVQWSLLAALVLIGVCYALFLV